MNKHFWFFAFLLLLFVPITTALQIDLQTCIADQNCTINAWVVNSSNASQTLAGVSCNATVYDKDFNTTYTSVILDDNNNGFYSSNISLNATGLYPTFIYCTHNLSNSTNTSLQVLNGYLHSKEFNVNVLPSGTGEDWQLAILLSLFVTSIMFFYYSLKLENSHTPIKLLLFFTGFGILISAVNVSRIFVEQSSTISSLVPLLEITYYILLWTFIITLAYFILLFLYKLFLYLFELTKEYKKR